MFSLYVSKHFPEYLHFWNIFKDYSKRSWRRLWCNSSKTSSGSPASLIHIHVLLYSLLHMHRHSRSQSAEGAGRIQIRMEPLLIDVLSDHAAASDTIGPDRLISRQQWGRWSQSGVYKVKKHTRVVCGWRRWWKSRWRRWYRKAVFA